MTGNFHFLNRIHRLKTTILALSSLAAGLVLLVVARAVEGRVEFDWLAFWPITEIGGTLTAAGLFGVAWDYVDGKDKEAREDERIRRLLKESAPDFRDAVIAGFAETPDSMRGVATSDTLDKLITNALGLRLGDAQFAREIYADVRDQAIRAAERWYDVQVSVLLSTAVERSAFGAPLFDVLIEWTYTTTPSHAVARFACVSDRDEFLRAGDGRASHLDMVHDAKARYGRNEAGVLRVAVVLC